MRLIRCSSAVGLTSLFVAVACCDVQGGDFRIESKTFVGKEKTPASENVTLFCSGVVYDYLLSEPERTAVFDKAHGRFILLDPARKVKTEIKTADVMAFSQSIQNAAAKSQNRFLKFSANPEFKSEFDEEREELTLTSLMMTYQVGTAKAVSLAEAQQYREFLDWYARLNAMTNPNSPPPFPRLILNEHLANRELVATRVQLMIPAQGLSKSQELHSEHTVAWHLLPRDSEKIAKTANQLTAFAPVSFNEFRSPGAGNRAPAVSKR